MNFETFERLKANLLERVTKQLSAEPAKRESYHRVFDILTSITYSNTKDKKGSLAYFVIDSYNGDKRLGSDLIDFDDQL